MQQRQLRLGDILDDYCPRERRLTNHAVVAMVGEDVKQTRCTTCDTEHGYKRAKVPRQRRKADAPAGLFAQVAAGAPTRIVPPVPAGTEPLDESAQPIEEGSEALASGAPIAAVAIETDTGASADPGDEDDATPEGGGEREAEEGPVHRPLIRATLPRQEGQPPPQRPAPEFTIRQPAGRQNRFRHQRGPQFQGQGNRSNGNVEGGPMRGGPPRHGGGRPPTGPATSRMARRHGHKRPK